MIERSCASWLSIVRRQLAAGNWKQHVAQLVPGVKSACLDTFRSGRERGPRREPERRLDKLHCRAAAALLRRRRPGKGSLAAEARAERPGLDLLRRCFARPDHIPHLRKRV